MQVSSRPGIDFAVPTLKPGDSWSEVSPRQQRKRPGRSLGGLAEVKLPNRVTRREARAAQRELMSGCSLTPEENHRLAMILVAHFQQRQAASRWFDRVLFGFVGVSCALILGLGAAALPPAIGAAAGQGVRGVFVPQYFTYGARGGGWWTGTFTSDSGQVEANVTYMDQLPPAAHAGSSVPALYQDRQAYALHGSTTWLQLIIFMILAAIGLVASIWCGPVRALKSRRNLEQNGTGQPA